MKLQVDIELSDGTKERVTVLPVSQVAYERQYKRPIDQTLGTEGLYWMVWHTLQPGVRFDDWLAADLVDADPVDDDEDGDIDPLAPSQPSGNSLPSPSSRGPASPSTG